MSNKIVDEDTGLVITSQIPQKYDVKYLVVVVDRGMTSEVNYFHSLKEAKRAFGKIARDHRYRPSEINGSDYYHVSIWEWTENRYEKTDFHS